MIARVSIKFVNALFVSLLLYGVICKAAKTLTISSASGFSTLANGLVSNTEYSTVTLTADVSLGLTRPIGMDANGNCHPFSGVFLGKNHKITLSMSIQDQANNPIKDAALFCGFKGDAEVDDLDILGSVSGRHASGLALLSTGNLSLKNVRTRATIKGKERASGLIGKIHSAVYSIVEFNGCSTLTGSITGSSSSWSSTVGGFVSIVSGNRNSVLLMSLNDCFNQMPIKGELSSSTKFSSSTYVGGLIGRVTSSYNATISFNSCKNQGAVSSPGTVNSESTNQFVGGFIGFISESFATRLKFYQCSNLNTVSATTSEGGSRTTVLGGILGFAENNEDFSMVINSTSNEGSISSSCKNATCSCFSAGLVGKVFTFLDYYNNSINIVNSFSDGIVSSSNGTSCGIICSDPSFNFGVRTEVYNCINKKDISGVCAYGIADRLTRANNIVNLGNVITVHQDDDLPTEACSFWGQIKFNATSLYGMENFISCGFGSVTTVKLSESQKYVIVSGGDEIELSFVLNGQSFLYDYGLYWDDSLKITGDLGYEFFIVRYGPPYDDSELVTSGGSPSLHPSEQWYFAGGCCSAKIDSSTVVDKDLDLTQCFEVSILEHTSLLEYGSRVNGGCSSELEQLFAQYHAIDSDLSSGVIEFFANSTIVRNTALVPTRKVTLTGASGQQAILFVKAGSSVSDKNDVFGDKDMFRQLNSECTIIDHNSSKEFNNKTVLSADVDLRACHELTVEGVQNGTWYVQLSKPLLDEKEDGGLYGDKLLLKDIFAHYHLVNLSTIFEYTATSTLDFDVTLTRCHRVLIHDSTFSTVYAIPGTTLSNNAELFGQVALLDSIFQQYHVTDSTLTQKYTRQQVVNKDMDLLLGLEIKLSGEINGSYFVEKGQPLSTCSVLAPFLNQTDLYIVRNEEKASSQYTGDSVITSDTSIAVVARCEVYSTEEKCKKTLTCEWSASRGCRSLDDESVDADDTGLIVAMSIVGAIALIGIFFAIFIPLYLTKKKEKEEKEDKEANGAEKK